MNIKSGVQIPKCLLSFIIVNWNGKHLLYNCISSILKFCSKIPHEIIVVDNASTDGSIDLIKKNFPQVILICNSTNRYFAGPTNDGIKISKGEFFFLLNNDIILTEGCIDKLINVLDKNKDIGVVVPQLRYPDGRIQPSCRRLPNFLNLYISGLGLDFLISKYSWKMRDFDHNHSLDVEQPMMSAFLIKRECWEDVGELDEKNFPLYFNDVDWCFRALKRGWRIRFEPQAVAIHLGAWSGERLGPKRIILSAQGLYNYFRKHHVLSAFSWRWPLLVGLTGGIILRGLLYQFKLIIKSFS